jgi:hypothetical protein
VLSLTYTAEDLRPFARDCGYDGEPYAWNSEQRFSIRCELDAAFFHLYGISEPDTAYVLDTFPLVRKADEEAHGTYRTKDTILRMYWEMATGAFVSSFTPQSGQQLAPEEPEFVQLDLFGDPVQDLPTGQDLVIQAFIDTRDGWSSEYVVCNPDSNRRFMARIRELNPRLSEEEANRMLWNARRSGRLSHLPKSKKYSPAKELLPFEFVCEWAYRHLIAELCRTGTVRKNTTLERILCIPDWRSRFDDLVTRIKPGFCPLDYRWVAMSLRKRSGEKRRAEQPSLFNDILPLAEASTKLPDLPGVYLIRSAADDQLYTGWTPNLREQANRLIDTGNGTMIPTWLLPNEAAAATVAFQPLEPGTKDIDLHDLWRANLYRRKPLLNLFDELAA